MNFNNNSDDDERDERLHELLEKASNNNLSRSEGNEMIDLLEARGDITVDTPEEREQIIKNMRVRHVDGGMKLSSHALRNSEFDMKSSTNKKSWANNSGSTRAHADLFMAGAAVKDTQKRAVDLEVQSAMLVKDVMTDVYKALKKGRKGEPQRVSNFISSHSRGLEEVATKRIDIDTNDTVLTYGKAFALADDYWRVKERELRRNPKYIIKCLTSKQFRKRFKEVLESRRIVTNYLLVDTLEQEFKEKYEVEHK